jgi:hypothetical protein
MTETNPPRVGERISVDGRDGVFLVLSVDHEAQSVSLLPSVDGGLLDNIPVDALTILPKLARNGESAG